MNHIVFLLILVVNPCDQTNLVNTNVARVMNGWAAKLGDVPYQVSFKTFKKGRYRSFCGGTIIGPNKLVSAAHCFIVKRELGFCEKLMASKKPVVSSDVLASILAVAGNMNNTLKNRNFGQWRRLKSMYVPANYKFPKNDISVGFTRKPFVFNSYVSSIPYATVFRDYMGSCLVSGFGRVSTFKGSNYLQLAHMDVLSLSVCTWLHEVKMRDFVCTADQLNDVGKGDSGGPLVCAGTDDPADKGQGVLVGVVSGNRRGSGSFFTRVSSFRGFIARGAARRLYGGVVWVAICLLHGGVLIF